MTILDKVLSAAPPNVRGVLSQLAAWGKRESGVSAVLLYGSVARECADCFSDIDVVLVRDPDTNADDLLLSLGRVLGPRIEITRKGTKVFYLKAPALKVEVKLSTREELPQFGGLFEGSRISDPRAMVLSVKAHDIEETVSAWSRSLGSPASQEDLEREAQSFLYHYEAFLAPFHRADHFRAYFHYSLAFFKLGDFLAAAHGQGDFLYAPERLVDMLDNLNPHLKRRFEACAPEWGRDMSPLVAKKEIMFDLFEDALRSCGPSASSLLNKAIALRGHIRERYPPLWRWRDLGGKGKIIPGRVFRAARLDRYSSDVLDPILRDYRIRTVVDLRNDWELKKHCYRPGALNGLRYVKLQMDSDYRAPRDSTPSERLQHLYASILDEPGFPQWLSKLMDEISTPSTLPLVFHCAAGGDRTGILSAMLLNLAGASDEEIVQDYLVTSGHVRREYIETLLSYLRGFGGAREYLTDRGVSPNLIDATVRVMTTPDSST
jgi:predicted nucleotidyltransferase